jgi:hypothetical protein
LRWSSIPVGIRIGKWLIFGEGGKPENLEKNPQSKGENQQTTQLA